MGSYPISVRDISPHSDFVVSLGLGIINLPIECMHNAEILSLLLGKVAHTAPNMSDLGNQTVSNIASAMAYALDPGSLGNVRRPQHSIAVFKRDPSALPVGFRFPTASRFEAEHLVTRQEQHTAYEFYRCLNLPYQYLVEFRQAVAHSQLLSLADSMAYVVDIAAFTPYRYDLETIEHFNARLESAEVGE